MPTPCPKILPKNSILNDDGYAGGRAGSDGQECHREFANMVTGNASALLENSGLKVDITPPSIVFGQDVYFIISSVQTLSIDMETPLGKIEVNIGLEI